MERIIRELVRNHEEAVHATRRLFFSTSGPVQGEHKERDRPEEHRFSKGARVDRKYLVPLTGPISVISTCADYCMETCAPDTTPSLDRDDTTPSDEPTSPDSMVSFEDSDDLECYHDCVERCSEERTVSDDDPDHVTRTVTKDGYYVCDHDGYYAEALGWASAGLNPPDGSKSLFDYLEETEEWFYTFKLDVLSHIFTEPISGEEWFLINVAWSLLCHNIDLVRWAVEYALGKSADRMEDALNGSLFVLDYEVHIFLDDWDNFESWGYPWSLAGAYIFIGRDSGIYKGPRKVWRCEDSSEVDKACAALDLAASIFHELLHICYGLGGDHRNQCDYSYMCENTLRYALFSRYTFAARGPCSGYSDEDLIFSDASTYVAPDEFDC